jgi:hypothetical protein
MIYNNAYNLNQDILKSIHITSQEHMIIKSFGDFYDNLIIINLFIPIINSNSKISIRLIDYFVTKYSKYNKINYKIIENNIESQFNVYTSYKQQLKAFQKKHFDPFSRGDRIPYFIGDTCIITTIGQLNFFKWFISKKIYDYVKYNHLIIENDMNKKNKNDKKKIKNVQDKNIKIKKNNNYIITKNSYINNIPNIINNNQLQMSDCNINNNIFKENNQIIVKFSF